MFTKRELNELLSAIEEVRIEAQKLSPMPKLKQSESPIIQGRKKIGEYSNPVAQAIPLFTPPVSPQKKHQTSPYAKIGPSG